LVKSDSCEFIIDSGHDPLPETELGRASTTRTVTDGDLIESFFADQTGEGTVEIAEKPGSRGR